MVTKLICEWQFPIVHVRQITIGQIGELETCSLYYKRFTIVNLWS